MNCFNHPELPAVAYCRTCGKALCAECRRTSLGTVYCEEHAPATVSGDPVNPPLGADQSFAPASPPYPGDIRVDRRPSPGVAFVLGLIPGVGAIYNGQYAKGLVHFVVFGLIVNILHRHDVYGWEPLFGMMIPVWVFYMAFEAYHTAQKRRDGERVDEFSSLIAMNQGPGTFPVGGIILIVLGVLLLLDTTGILSFDRLLRYWPVGLILLGAYMLYGRFESSHAEVRDERR
ncbi:MAG: B-box zinc finger protein [Bryobacteraceae bacterium]